LNVLAVVAHPDDEVIGCGGTLAKLVENAADVRVLLPLRRNDPRGVEHWERLIEAFRQACAHLGATAIVAPDLIDERVAETEVSRVHDAIVAMVDWADVVFTHWTGDANQVHRGVGRAVEVATRPFRRRKEVYLFEVVTSTEQGFGPTFSPNAYSLLTAAHVERKCDAMAFYATENTGSRSPEALRRKMQVRGDEVGVAFAESFHLAHHFF
jgi:LmbE family N-acetylglucosaminyl deacetylase